MASASDIRLGVLAAAALALAGWSGWSRPLPGATVAAAARSGAWVAIDWKPSDGVADAKLLAQRNTWGWSDPARAAGGGGPAQPGAAPQAALLTPAQTGPWRIVGTADWGEGLAAIVQTQPPGTPKVQYVFRLPGETLPDGRTVTRVEPARVNASRPGSTAEEPAIVLFGRR
jgi:hypothetical protein